MMLATPNTRQRLVQRDASDGFIRGFRITAAEVTRHSIRFIRYTALAQCRFGGTAFNDIPFCIGWGGDTFQ